MSLYAVPAGLNADAYKSGHIKQYPANTDKLFFNVTPRASKYFPSPLKVNGMVSAGIRRFVEDYLIDHWNDTFFNRPKEEAVQEILTIMNGVLGNKAIDADHWESLHDLGYLPVKVYAVPEGLLVPIKSPLSVFYNTVKGFHWVAGFLEDAFSAELWKSCTIATIAMHYKRLGKKYSDDTCDNDLHLPWQFHDFSMRGLSGLTDDAFNNIGHLFSFKGTDGFPVVYTAKRVYGQEMDVSEIGGSIPATEHSVMCANISDVIAHKKVYTENFAELNLQEQRLQGEVESFERLLTKYPSGLLSVVSDTYDFWQTLNTILPTLRDKIMSRDGKLVVRPDSGDPVKVVTGYKCIEIGDLQDRCNLSSMVDMTTLVNYPEVVQDLKDSGYEMVVDKETFDYIETVDLYSSDLEPKIRTVAEVKGAIQTLYDIFGGVVNSKGYKELDSHIGLIYGDSITIQRAHDILKRLKEKGFASNCVVFGVGSYTYQYLTRDCFAMAVKATYAEIGGNKLYLSKDPVTDDGTKKSANGCVLTAYTKKTSDGDLKGLGHIDGLTLQEFESKVEGWDSGMALVFEDSNKFYVTNLDKIRSRIDAQIEMGKHLDKDL